MKNSATKVGMAMLLLLFCASVLAGDKNSEPGKKVQVIYKKSEAHRFSGLKLKGQLKKPELSYIYQRKGIRSEQIIDIPENFNQEIREGAEKF